ncbi:glycosyltransferase [Nitratidesulfovibrio sp. HK-II]|uniref:glycosyltransferase n=1 Tax=Nitratidesulfovibrio sp. HK-II TaxID=2009266 RepID=UPI000E2F6F2F|nr:glycosyltransferase [Nitratidesulfovibrio sp. HK-II]
MPKPDRREVTFVLNTLGTGGAERVCHTLSCALASRGWAVTIVTLFQDEPIAFGPLPDSVRHVALDCRHARTSLVPLAAYIRRHQPKLVVPWIYGLAVALTLIRAAGLGNFILLPRNVTAMSAYCRSQRSLWQRKLAPAIARAIYGRADHYIAQCGKMKEEMATEWGIERTRISVIPNPVAECYLAPLPSTAQRATPPELLFVGRLQPPKGIDKLVEAFARARQLRPNLVLRIVGDGPDRTMLERRVRDLGLSGSVILEGWQQGLRPYYLKASATLLTSDCEGFPNVLLESLASGTPTVAFDCPTGPREIIRDKRDGFLVPPGDIQYFAERCVEVLEWPPLEQDRRFAPDVIVDSYETLFSDMLTRSALQRQ